MSRKRRYHSFADYGKRIRLNEDIGLDIAHSSESMEVALFDQDRMEVDNVSENECKAPSADNTPNNQHTQNSNFISAMDVEMIITSNNLTSPQEQQTPSLAKGLFESSEMTCDSSICIECPQVHRKIRTAYRRFSL